MEHVEHDDNQAPGQWAFTWRTIDMPTRANGNWSQATQKDTSLQHAAGGGCLLLSQPVTWSVPQVALIAQEVGVGVCKMKAIHRVKKIGELLPPNCTQRTTSEVFD